MADAADPAPLVRRRRGPRPGDGALREGILAAARGQFADRGYDAPTMRQIAQAAGVDTKLVYYYFGSKEGLFGATIAEPFRAARLPDLLAAAPPGPDDSGSPGQRYLLAVLTALETSDFGAVFIGLIRGLGTHEPSRRIFLHFIKTEVIDQIAPRLPEPLPPARAALVGSHLLGLVTARYLLQVEPLASLPIDQLAATVGPTIDHYLFGDIPLAAAPD
ncbi:MAG: TetR family transcriptional regulator [Bifidobacteriaceae bacterium]|jgi:AcrR family transcriptional regulator|nr:TetR family transcriptional regulator [Bifidobacteriaceae bacterium]